jgi:heterotetrameric sarcosine oxidase gamma subunit
LPIIHQWYLSVTTNPSDETLKFLSVDAAVDVIARSPMESQARAAGARFQDRDGWNVAVGYGTPEQESVACTTTAGWSDVSHLGKLELQDTGVAARLELELGAATRRDGAWWCPLTPDRALVICDPGRLAAAREQVPDGVGVVEVTTAFAAMTLVGPLSREVFARFCAADLRPKVTPIAGLRPVSIARQPGVIVREDEDRFLFLFGWAIARYMWTVVDDAARHLGGQPVGVDALQSLEEPLSEVSSNA